jgi:hypothetical protein
MRSRFYIMLLRDELLHLSGDTARFARGGSVNGADAWWPVDGAHSGNVLAVAHNQGALAWENIGVRSKWEFCDL